MYKSQIPKPRTESDDLTQAKGLDFFPFQISFNQKPETWQARLPPLKFLVSPGPGAKQRPQQTPKLTNLEAEGPDVQKFQPNLKIAEKETTQKKGKAGAESPSQTSFAHVRRVVLFQEIASLGDSFKL